MTPASRTAAPRKRLNRADREATLLDAAHKIVADGGIEALTMEGMAAGAGVNKALAYRFFTNRDDVLLALWDRETAAFDAQIAEALESKTTLEAQLRTILEVWLDRVEAGGGALGRLEAPGIGPPELEARRRERLEGTVEFIAELIRAEYHVPHQDAVIAAAVLGQGAQGMTALWVHTGWPRRRLVNTFVRLCLGAIESVAR